jgi:hypothetical protein
MTNTTMNSYIDAVCEGKPLDLPNFNEDTEQWELAFEESETPWHPYDSEKDILFVSFESAEEVTDAYNYYNQNPAVGLQEVEGEQS